MAGPEYIMDQDVVFVSFNYRLAILGEIIMTTVVSRNGKLYE